MYDNKSIYLCSIKLLNFYFEYRVDRLFREKIFSKIMFLCSYENPRYGENKLF